MKIKQHIAFIILCLILFTYLGVKTLPENGWSEWLGGEGDAQTLLSSKHWVNDGFIYSKFLFIPIGYSKIVQYLDQPEMRQHARGTTTGKLIGNRLYYTHYPPGYLFPYALLMKLGFNQRYWFRLLALIFSFSALILLYVFFNLISKNSLVSFFAIAYYALSTMFLDYADSLANQPIDDLLRAAILVVSMLAIRAVSLRNETCHSELTRECHPELTQKCHPELASPATPKRSDGGRVSGSNPMRSRNKTCAEFISVFGITPKFYFGLIWFLYLILSLSSYDSTFFVFIWLVGLDIVTMWSPALSGTEPAMKKISKIFSTAGKKWLFFASAPILAFVLQIMQNWWYLGSWREVWLDMMGAAVAKAYTSNILSHFANIFYPFFLMTGFKIFWATILILALFIFLKIIDKNHKIYQFFNSNLKSNVYHLLILLFIAGAFYPFIFISAGRFSYQGRQMMPLIALLIGLATIFIVRVFKNKQRIYILPLIFLIVVVIFLWGGQIYRTIQYVYDWPNNRASDYVIQLSKSLKPLANSDSIIFYQGDRLSVSFIAEYYFNMPILFFKKKEDFIKDFLWLRKKSQYPFEAIIMTDHKETNDNLRQLLLEQKISRVENAQFIQGEYIFKVLPQE